MNGARFNGQPHGMLDAVAFTWRLRGASRLAQHQLATAHGQMGQTRSRRQGQICTSRQPSRHEHKWKMDAPHVSNGAREAVPS